MPPVTPGNQWIVCQIGAREHYAIPRALRLAGQEVRLITDYYHAGGDKSRALTNRLKQRFHLELQGVSVSSFNRSFLLHEFAGAIQRSGAWARIIRRNHWFEQRAATIVDALASRCPEETFVFSYSYAARRIFEAAKARGAKTILGQIDPGPAEARIVSELNRKARLPAPAEAPREYWDQWRKECELADVIIVNSEWSRDGLLSEGVSADKLRIVPLAYESNETHSNTRSLPAVFSRERPLRILFLGQVILRKGVLELLEAAKLLRGEPVEWLIVGGGDERLLRESRGIPNVRVTGAVSREATADFYQQADAFLLPTHSDGYAITQLEAANRGLPMVVSRNCGRVVEHDQNGLLLDEVTAEDIAQAVKFYLEFPAALERHTRGQSRFEPHTIADLGEALASVTNHSCSLEATTSSKKQRVS